MTLKTTSNLCFAFLLFLLTPLTYASAAAPNAPALFFDIENATQQGKSYIIPIVLHSEEVVINAAEIELLADPDMVSIEHLSLSPSICSEEFLMAEVAYPEYGIGYTRCGTAEPLTATTTILGTVTVNPLQGSMFSLAFGQHTNLHAHDALGSQILPKEQSFFGEQKLDMSSAPQF